MILKRLFQCIACFAVLFFTLLSFKATAQYRVDFNSGYEGFYPNNLPGWRTITGDGNIIFRQKVEGGSAVLNVDSRMDKRNIWYAFMHQSISDVIDMDKLSLPEFELRMEARVKPSHAPRRINMYLSSLDTGGFLREFDLEKANEWYLISMVTDGYSFDPEKPLMTQISMMDWGVSDIYELHIDYIQVDLVNINDNHIQHGLPLEYHEVLKSSSYQEEIIANTNLIDKSFPDEVITPWLTVDGNDSISVLQVDQSKIILLNWDLTKFKGKHVKGTGQLELSTQALLRRKDSPKDFGMIRLCEIMNTNTNWKNDSLTYNRFKGNRELHKLIVSQCIVDSKVQPVKEGKTIVNISQPVLQRLIDGRTNGIAILPLGLISAAFFDSSNGQLAPVLRFNSED